MPGHAEAVQVFLQAVMQNEPELQHIHIYQEVLIRSNPGCRSLFKAVLCKHIEIAPVHCIALYVLSCLLIRIARMQTCASRFSGYPMLVHVS